MSAKDFEARAISSATIKRTFTAAVFFIVPFVSTFCHNHSFTFNSLLSIQFFWTDNFGMFSVKMRLNLYSLLTELLSLKHKHVFASPSFLEQLSICITHCCFYRPANNSFTLFILCCPCKLYFSAWRDSKWCRRWYFFSTETYCEHTPSVNKYDDDHFSWKIVHSVSTFLLFDSVILGQTKCQSA